MNQEQIENLESAFGALQYAIDKSQSLGGVVTAKGLIAFNKAIKEHIAENIWKGRMFTIQPSPEFKLQETILQDAYDYTLTMINIHRQEDEDYTGEPRDIVVAHYGPFMVNEDASIDYGGNVGYHHGADWHVDEHHFSHMFAKRWVENSLSDYIDALAHSAKIQGLKSFTINVDRISTK